MKRSHGGAVDPALLDFSANVNPLGPPDGVRAVLERAMDLVPRYPTPDAREFCLAAGHRYGMRPDGILAGNGASDLIYLVTRLFAGQRFRVLVPAFSEYEDACEAAGLTVNEGGETVTFLANPTSPEGRLVPRQELLRMKGTLVVDESFMDFVDDAESLLLRATEDPRLIVIRSLTKFYALAGLRLGFLAATPAMVTRLKRFQPPWSVNALAQAAGIAALKDRSYADLTRHFIHERREELMRGLFACGLDPLPSVACFILCKVPDAGDLCRELLERGIAARNCDSFTGLEKNRYVRFAVRKSEENKRLLSALREIREKCLV